MKADVIRNISKEQEEASLKRFKQLRRELKGLSKLKFNENVKTEKLPQRCCKLVNALLHSASIHSSELIYFLGSSAMLS